MLAHIDQNTETITPAPRKRSDDLRHFIDSSTQFLKRLDQEGFKDYRKQVERVIRQLAVDNLRLERRVERLSERMLLKDLLPLQEKKKRAKSICDILFEEAIRIGKPHKVFFTRDFVNVLQQRRYSGKSFSRNPARTVYVCVMEDPKKRFYRPSKFFKEGFALNRDIAAQMASGGVQHRNNNFTDSLIEM